MHQLMLYIGLNKFILKLFAYLIRSILFLFIVIMLLVSLIKLIMLLNNFIDDLSIISVYKSIFIIKLVTFCFYDYINNYTLLF
jgi:hypothetical protein